VGILTIREKWERTLGWPSFDKQEGDYKDLDRALVVDNTIGGDIIYLIHGNILPTPKLVKAIRRLKPGQFISVPDRENIVYCISAKQVEDENKIRMEKAVELDEDLKEVKYPWDMIELNAWAIEWQANVS
jgi:hypothetical protein